MLAHAVILRYTPAYTRVSLREICAADELAFSDTSTRSALLLLDRLMELNGAESKKIAAQIVTADRDQMLAFIYATIYGDKIESTIRCQSCETRFDMDFSLHDLQRHLIGQEYPNTATVEQHGIYRLAPDCLFRLPTGEDELAAEGLLPDQAGALILKQCLLEGDAGKYAEKVEAAMAALAPVLQTDIQATCPECGQAQTLFFDIQSFLLGRLLNERKQTIREIHCLATAYRWSHTEILSLPRGLRQAYCNHVDTER